jgi:hypothetical protein
MRLLWKDRMKRERKLFFGGGERRMFGFRINREEDERASTDAVIPTAGQVRQHTQPHLAGLLNSSPTTCHTSINKHRHLPLH